MEILQIQESEEIKMKYKITETKTITKEIDVLPCPFCGSDNIKPFHTSGFYGYSPSEDYVTCRSCGTNGPIVKDHNGGNNIERAIEKWNHREN